MQVRMNGIKMIQVEIKLQNQHNNDDIQNKNLSYIFIMSKVIDLHFPATPATAHIP